jgi:AraC family transcriptional regulator
MDLLERMNNAMDYIEDNLTGEIKYENIAQIVCCSVNHFQRMFSFITGITLSEYIRRRRLTLAALELQKYNSKIIDIAFKYGYDSPDSFTRAFVRLHGITPTSAHDAGVELKSYSKMVFHISLKGDMALNYRFIESDSFELIGKGIMLSMDDIRFKVPEFWRKCDEDGTTSRLSNITKGERVFGVSNYKNDNLAGTFSYHIAFENNFSLKDSDFEILNIPRLNWVVFESRGPQPKTIHELWVRVYSEWFPSSGYKELEGPRMEVYHADMCQAWIPVMKI